MPAYVISFSDMDSKAVGLVGPKARNLGELRHAGLPVPDGFCVTTEAFTRFTETAQGLDRHYARLAAVPDDQEAAQQVAADLRACLDDREMPGDVRDELLAAWRLAGDGYPYAIRSSGVAEDLAGASFAGQHDTFLNVSGEDALIGAVRRCWLSAFTDRAVAYRASHGLSDKETGLAVIVQRMVASEVSGVMFTADPVSSDRCTVVINAAYGLGESVASGLVNPDIYRIGRDGELAKTIADKPFAVVPRATGGVRREDVPPAKREGQALPDGTIIELAGMGKRIAALFGAPQDIEWASVYGSIMILQARPITSLYPIPRPGDDRLHVYFSFGHQQMMTDAIKPLGISVLRTFLPFGKRFPDRESRQLAVAGDRLFYDFTEPLHSKLGKPLFTRLAGALDKRVRDALREISDRPEFRRNHQFSLKTELIIDVFAVRAIGRIIADLCWADMTGRQAAVNGYMERAVAAAWYTVAQARGAERIGRIQDDLREQSAEIYVRLTLTRMTAMLARVIAELLCARWLDDPADLSALSKSPPGNVTTEMTLAVGDLADMVRDDQEMLDLLREAQRQSSLRVLESATGGKAFSEAVASFLVRYGMCAYGEIDITRPRWREDPGQLMSGIVAAAQAGRPGEHRVRFAAGEREAAVAAERLIAAARATRFGRQRAAVLARLITVHRTLIGLREHPKLLTMGLFDVYRQAIKAEAQALAARGVLAAPDDVDYLSLSELRLALTDDVPAGLLETIRVRKAAHARYAQLVPPWLVTSDGEVISWTGSATAGANVLTGIAASAGTVEGTARVVLEPGDARLRDGDILVAPYTDPAWTTLFSAIRGVVVEIGSAMSHGAVVARELGLPAVVSVNGATRHIPDGARIRVDGSRGTVQLLQTGQAR